MASTSNLIEYLCGFLQCASELDAGSWRYLCFQLRSCDIGNVENKLEVLFKPELKLTLSKVKQIQDPTLYIEQVFEERMGFNDDIKRRLIFQIIDNILFITNEIILKECFEVTATTNEEDLMVFICFPLKNKSMCVVQLYKS